MRNIIICVLAALLIAGCASNKEGNRPVPGSALGQGGGTVTEGNLRDQLVLAGADTRLRAFAAPAYDYPRGGRQATVAEVVADLESSGTPRVFGSNISRTNFVHAMSERFTEVNSAPDLVAILRDPARHRVVECSGVFSTFGYDPKTSRFGPLTRNYVPGEKCVEFMVAGEWAVAFSLGCLNPADGPIVRVIEPVCSQTWAVPGGPTDDGSVIVFVPKEAIPCLPPTVRCDSECEDWMRGRRGTPDDPAIEVALKKMIGTGGGAYRLAEGTSEIKLPAASILSLIPAWCDQDEDGEQEAHFMAGIKAGIY